MLDRIFNYLLQLPRAYKVLGILFADLLALPFAVYSAHVLRFADLWPLPYLTDNVWMFVWVMLFGPIIFTWLGLYRAVVRYMGWHALSTVFLGSLLLSLSFYVVATLLDWMLPRSLPIIFFLLAVLYIGGTRVVFRQYYRHHLGRYTELKTAAIYGAGSAGLQLMQALQVSNQYRVVALLDDDKRKWKSKVLGITISSPELLSDMIKQRGIHLVLLAMPSASRERRRQILDWLSQFPVEVRSMPSMADLAAGKTQLDSLQKIEIEDLLGRDAVPPVDGLLHKNITNKAVMVTGAGGSIGAELCRQIIQQSPRVLVLFELSEFALYQIDQELRRRHPDAHCVAILGNVLDMARVREVMSHYAIDTLYHAAAYKHVPLVEHNVVEGVRNNVFGTQTVAQAALDMGVSRFVLISTDKAVRPTNVMGASKRLAEQVLQHFAQAHTRTCFTMVRFGNVLGSSGSVVPVFKRQIAQGGPITVTHPEITRYFMTIPEAASLVIQAGAMAQGGEVFVLDMGDPVKIVDLAKRMIHLSGLELRDSNHLSGDIEISFTGLRPGEKLYEELLIADNVVGSDHPKIMRALEGCLPEVVWKQKIALLQQALQEKDVEATFELVKSMVPEFVPVTGLSDVLLTKK